MKNKIIRDTLVLSPNYKPIVLPVRKTLVDKLTEKLKISNNISILLAGLTGTGKTISVEKAIENLNKNKDLFIFIYVNCSECKNYTSIAKRVIESVKGKMYDERGKTKSQLAEDIKKTLLTKRTKKLVFVFDEVDKLIVNKSGHEEILFPLLNHSASSFILISNDTNILSKLDNRIQSRLSAEVENIEVYQPGEIYEILNQRAELGLYEKSYDQESIMFLSKFSSEISGDIRFALRLFEKAASISEARGLDKIDKNIIIEVIDELENSEFDKKFMSLNKHQKLTLLAISLECIKTKEGYAITYPDSYKNYVFQSQNHGLIPMGDRRYRDFLNQLQMLDLISLQNKSTHKAGGRVRIAVPNFDYEKLLKRLEPEYSLQGEQTE